jgi:hypothetical protein
LISLDQSRVSVDALVPVEAGLELALSFTPEEAWNGQGAML